MTDLDIIRQQTVRLLQLIENEQETRRIAEQAALDIKKLESKADDLELETRRIADVQEKHRGFLVAIPYLNRRGFRFTWQEEGRVGQECSRISRTQFNDEPGSPDRIREWHGCEVNTYLPDVLDAWIQQHGHRYTRIKK